MANLGTWPSDEEHTLSKYKNDDQTAGLTAFECTSDFAGCKGVLHRIVSYI